MCTGDYRRGLDWWIDLLTTCTHDSEIHCTCNYSATANLHNSQITTAPAKSSPYCYVFTRLSLATTSSSENSSAPHVQVLSSQTPVQNGLCRPNLHQDNPVSNSTSTIVARRFVSGGTCLSSRCLEMGLMYLLTSWLLHTNGFTCYNIIICLLHKYFVFYAVRVASKESRRLVLPRTSCYILQRTLQQECDGDKVRFSDSEWRNRELAEENVALI
jgi:hypothetical protein